MQNLQQLVKEVSSYYKKEGRTHLPWRGTGRPLPAGRQAYKILVSEIMLQQTQVDRVLPKYKSFLRQFPTAQVLAKAPLSRVLAEWQGLGYNRRAKHLQQAAKVIAEKYGGKFPHDPALIDELPGVGHYTARAIATFAFDRPEVFIETNIRTVFTRHLLSHKLSRRDLDKVDDKELLPLIEAALPLAKKAGLSPRQWYAALMDYGSFLKRSGVRLNSASKHYTKQSRFAGSARQLRGAILRELLKNPATPGALVKTSKRTLTEVSTEILRLKKEGLIRARGKTFAIAE